MSATLQKKEARVCEPQNMLMKLIVSRTHAASAAAVVMS